MNLSVNHLDVHLDRRSVLHGVGLQAPSGSWTAVIGPNGAGKSTLLRAVLGVVPSIGEISLDGADPRRMRARERARVVAYSPQTPQLPSGMSVTEYVLLGRSPYIPYLGRESAHDRRVTADVLARLSLTDLSERPVDRLSGGERQRVVLARALAQQAPLLLLDEPTSALDIGHQQQVMELIDELRRADGLTVITTIHDLTLAGQYADALVLLTSGRVAASGTPQEVLTAEVIERHFGARVYIASDVHGRPILGLSR